MTILFISMLAVQYVGAEMTITTNDISVEEVKELLSTGKVVAEKVKAGGWKELALYWKVLIVLGCLYVLYKAAQLIVKLTPNKKDDAVIKKANKVVEKVIKPLARLLFGHLPGGPAG